MRASLTCGLAMAMLLAATPNHAQSAPDTAAPPRASGDAARIYEREIFNYERAGRRDPFRSLLHSAELGVRVTDLTLKGVVYYSNPAQSVAVLENSVDQKRYRLRVGDVLGPIRVVSIQPASVDVVVQELGVARRETLLLKPTQRRSTS